MPDFDVQVDINYLAKVVTEVRDLAETVRTYGRAGASTIAAATPTALHVIAAYLESEMRSWAHTDGTHARLFNEQLGGEAIRFPELRAVLTYVTPSPVSREVQQAELRAAGARLRAVAQELPSRMTTGVSPIGLSPATAAPPRRSASRKLSSAPIPPRRPVRRWAPSGPDR